MKRLYRLLAVLSFLFLISLYFTVKVDAAVYEETPISETYEKMYEETFTETAAKANTASNITSAKSSLQAQADKDDLAPLEVHFIDVGQGDSTLVLCGGEAMLIDGGTSGNSDLIYSYLKKRDISNLNYVIASHPHDDHIGGLAGALNFATVQNVLCSVNTYESEAFGDFLKYVNKQNLTCEIPNVGDSFSLGDAGVEILAVNLLEDENDGSIVLRVVHGDNSFLFTADAGVETEKLLLESEDTLQSTVLKVSHHGSDSGTDSAFLEAVAPQYAMISVGKENAYGHPTQVVLERLKEAGVTTFRTDLQGDVICQSDGKTITVNVEKNADIDTFQVGSSVAISELAIVSDTDLENTERALTLTEQEAEVVKGLPVGGGYVLNISSKKFHYEDCKSVKLMNEKNKGYHSGTREECIDVGYMPCKNCDP